MPRAMKWLSAGRTDLGDASTSPNQVYFEDMWTKAYTAQICRSISDVATEPWKHYHPSYMPNEPKGTSSLSVLDKDGIAVALTTTINLDFGSMLYDIESGIVLNSEMDDFSIPLACNAYNLEPSVYNEVGPKKRPLSSCAPTIILKDGTAELIIGASGGSQIVTSIFMSIVKFYKWGWPLLEVIKSPRVHHQLIPEAVYAEYGLPEWVSEGLKTKGHMVCRQLGGSVVQTIARTGVGEILAVSDWWRKDGVSVFFFSCFETTLT
jgi:gamma-glutamyltranspeptidase/glutathione hydrolase/gamma-glutamyltranspeptidase/glutathione hydrolase/leukotriene-C4 hydrolase